MNGSVTSENRSKPKNVFERNPKKSIFLTLLFFTVTLVFLSEKYLEWKTDSDERAGIVRYIRLRENPPLTEYEIIPNEHYMKTASQFDRKNHRLKVDRNGFIYPSVIHENPDLKIVFLGGSVVESLYVEEKNRFPYLVGRLLEKDGMKVNSYNGGVAGNDSMHSLNILMNKVMPLEPHIVLIMHNINDLSALLHEKSYWNTNPTRGVIIDETLELSMSGIMRQLKNSLIPNLYIRVRNILHSLRKALHLEEDEFARTRGMVTVQREHLRNDFRKNLQTFIGICRSRNIVPVLVTMASRLKEKPDEVIRGGMGNLPYDLEIEYSQFRELFLMFNDIIRDVGRENGVMVIDLERKIPTEQEYIYDIIHFTDKGSIMAAQIITDELNKDVLKKTKFISLNP